MNTNILETFSPLEELRSRSDQKEAVSGECVLFGPFKSSHNDCDVPILHGMNRINFTFSFAFPSFLAAFTVYSLA